MVSGYHAKCIDPWLVKTKRICPQCRKRVFESNERGAGLISVSSEDAPGSDSDSDFAQPSRSVLKRVKFHFFTSLYPYPRRCFKLFCHNYNFVN